MKPLLAILALVGLIVLGTTLTANAVVRHPLAEPDGTVINVAVAGDSFSARPGNWTGLPQDADVKIVANYSISGATCEQILNNAKPTPNVDVLIVECGNNDVNQHLTWASMQANAQAIAKKIGAQHVLISAVGPSNIIDNGAGINRRDGNQNASKYLASMAANNGYMFVDPFTSLKNWDNSYAPGMYASDGVHPSAEGMTVLQTRYDAFVRQAVYGAGPS